jgi:dTDP-glucose 4,6-dehydratase
MRIIVTGAAGFLGSHLCDRLVGAGHDVVGIDNLITGNLSNLNALLGVKQFTFIQHDITRPLILDGPVHQIYHFASPASPVDYAKFPIQTLKVGALGTLNVLGIAKTHQARVLIASTSEVYGDPLVHPQTESYWGNVNPIGDRSCYDESKRFAEALMMAYHHEHGIETRIMRIFNTYGPRMRLNDGRAIPNFLTQALRGEDITVYGDGSQTRSFCYVSDLIDGAIRLMNSTVNTPVNIGNPNEMTLIEMATKIKIETQSKAEIVFKPLPSDDPKVRRPDITKALRLLEWSPKVELDEGLKSTIAYFEQALAVLN